MPNEVLHRWNATYSQVFGNPAPQLIYQARDITIAWHGAHLLPQWGHPVQFPGQQLPVRQRAGEARQGQQAPLDAGAQHPPCVTVEADGTIWVPAHHYRPDGMPGVRGLKPWYYEDEVLKVSPEGKVLDEISILGAFAQRPGTFGITYGPVTR